MLLYMYVGLAKPSSNSLLKRVVLQYPQESLALGRESPTEMAWWRCCVDFTFKYLAEEGWSMIRMGEMYREDKSR